jgi:cell division protein FtsL
MRGLIVFVLVVLYLFALVYIESELVKLEVKKEKLQERVTELENTKEMLEFEITKLNNLAYIEAEAKKRNFIYPCDEEILGVTK